jgi:hypothetical protein
LNSKKKYKAIFNLLLAVTVILLTAGALPLHAQQKSAAEYQVKAVFLYNFTQFVDWPPGSFTSPDDPFIIGIVGDDPFGNYLDEAIANEKIGTHPIQVRRFNGLKGIGACHMLYINSDDPDWVERVLNSIEGKNILTVSDAPAFNKMGGMIRFFKEDNKIRLQINISRSKEAQLSISSKLLSVAKTN